jgi:hypothetical protein
VNEELRGEERLGMHPAEQSSDYYGSLNFRMIQQSLSSREALS